MCKVAYQVCNQFAIFHESKLAFGNANCDNKMIEIVVCNEMS